ncbi:GNAT family N-acetyltransferase [Gordonia humi]|uniref:Ribosomal protein S18 acetylase RimI-like enzyme n=1 Tax=Gordonia humi TaxID=686429 RepID=A0A840EYG8_9ACTN|nr:GNAT family N-acetyltransferase [Gordonia humi]MBB4136672.1 ribosomal protein S18 acetylase RimI-like enzyme [Gordonia humi]
MTAVGLPSETVLDNPAYASLHGAHAHLAERVGNAVRYPADVSPFTALPDDTSARDWADLAELIGPGGRVSLSSAVVLRPPAGWSAEFSGEGVQLVGDDVRPGVDERAVPLGSDDVPAMLDLVARTAPGPFETRTVDLGDYYGIIEDGRLVAMAGERLRPPGWTEISAVCTDPRVRGRGLATALVLTVAAGIRARGETPFLHAAADNTNAIRLYESLGFRRRRRVLFTSLIAP